RLSSPHGRTVLRRGGDFCPIVFPAGIAAADCRGSAHHSRPDRFVSLSIYHWAGLGCDPVVLRWCPSWSKAGHDNLNRCRVCVWYRSNAVADIRSDFSISGIRRCGLRWRPSVGYGLSKRGGPPVIGRPFSRHIYCWNCHWRTAWTNRGSTHRRVVPLAYWHGSGVAACSSIGELFFVAHTTGQKIFSHDDITA